MSQPPFTAEDLYLYSMHLLEPEENQRLEEFLQRSSEARAELLHVRRDLAYLALSTEPQIVPEVARHRLMNQIAREPKAVLVEPMTFPVGEEPPAIANTLRAAELQGDRYTPAAAAKRVRHASTDQAQPRGFLSRLLPWTGWALAAGLAFSTWTLHQRSLIISGQVAEAKSSVAHTSEASAKAGEILETLRSASSQRFLLTAQGTSPVPSARVSYLPASGSVVFQGNDLEALPDGKTYELWLVPADKGAKPIPAGTFKPDIKGYASLILPALSKGITAGTFGITMENQGGSEAPTLPILLVGV